MVPQRVPLLFVGHGNPMNALLKNSGTQSDQKNLLGKALLSSAERIFTF
jgi:aromatic ring-opening dioxygenase catalytic subunit (LigB family)